MRILLLAGSPSQTSRSTRLLHHIGERLASRGHRHDKLHVIDLPAQALLQADFQDPTLLQARSQVEEADAVVVSTPVYKASYSGALKVFLDMLPQDGFAGKLVLPLATGGSQSHMLALDYALRPVLSALAARHVLPSIYATDAQVIWSADKGLAIDAAIARRIDDGVDGLCAGLDTIQKASVANAVFAPVPFAQVRCSV
jgi:FMN reductase